jgi:hypothetical protein
MSWGRKWEIEKVLLLVEPARRRAGERIDKTNKDEEASSSARLPRRLRNILAAERDFLFFFFDSNLI